MPASPRPLGYAAPMWFPLLLLACAARHPASPTPPPVDAAAAVVTDSGLRYWTLRPGTGPVPRRGQTVAVHYTGWLKDGPKFDSSLERGRPLVFTVGVGQVIAGWDEAVSTMGVGEVREVEIPPGLGYGPTGAGGVIPGGATLIFEIELLRVVDG